MFISFSICCNHFTSLAYEIFYARKVDLFDKIKEVVFSQLFPCVHLIDFETHILARVVNLPAAVILSVSQNLKKKWVNIPTHISKKGNLTFFAELGIAYIIRSKYTTLL
jgi:hypothetical protein